MRRRVIKCPTPGHVAVQEFRLNDEYRWAQWYTLETDHVSVVAPHWPSLAEQFRPFLEAPDTSD
jgi:hypothetical protein